MIRSAPLRRFARNACAFGALVCLVMLGLELTSTGFGPTSGAPGALAAGAGTAPNGTVNISPTSGSLSEIVALRPDPSPAFCPGDSVAGYRWQTFISAAANDPAIFVYDSNGPTLPGGGVDPSFPLVSRTGINQVNRNTASDTGSGGLISPIPGFDLSVYGSALPDGEYSIGFACSLATETVSFWSGRITISDGTFTTPATPESTTTTSTTTTTTTAADGTTTTTVAGGTTSTTVATGGNTAVITPSSPTPGGSYSVSFPSCRVGETITFSQPESTPASVTDECDAPTALTSSSIAGIRRPVQATTGTATATFTAPTTPGSYTLTMTGTTSAQQTVTFVVVGPTTPVGGGNNAFTGGNPSSSTGTIPATGSSTSALVVWGALLLVFGRMVILLGRQPKVITGT